MSINNWIRNGIHRKYIVSDILLFSSPNTSISDVPIDIPIVIIVDHTVKDASQNSHSEYSTITVKVFLRPFILKNLCCIT